ncbi:glycosyltransferase family 2 protein [Oscillospiraceae bacterium N12]|jgi:glycosyltransferase involved in cell wall biosynthesis|uniref:Glycosyltransferase family 2 protein n=1 Tax=Jilunia laotingensis TaxID=2763675 RepID=A0A926IL07_9BACT|nr:glycosyltransferase family 2 protein [Jilunia laotingensis]MBC8594462.1 glycosyltransferase family 2 protein [Jilunia laotingensis]
MKLSIITPVYNRADCIIRCLKSVAQQNSSNEIEHWIVDDGSTDESYKLAKEFSEKHNNIHLLKFDINRGVNAARNYAISCCTGDYILFLDSDDELTEDAIQIIQQTLVQYDGYEHYLFAVDSRENYYQAQPLLQGTCSVINYKDWIQGKIDGDFAHVVSRKIMKKYSFNEQIRIYEKITFFKYYKDSKQQFFTHKTIKKVENGRNDSVSFDYFLNNRNSIHNQGIALQEIIYTFHDDYIKYGENEKLMKMITKSMFLLIADEDYLGYDSMLNSFKKRILFIQIIRFLHLGKLLRWFIISYSKIKNNN